MNKLLLKGATLIDEQAQIISGKDILVEDGKIAKIAPNLESLACEVLDCTGKFITCGFTLLHAHSPMHIFRGLAEDVNIDDWFNKEIFPYESKMTDEDVYWGARLCMAEMLENGVTAFADHYFAAEQIAQAALDSGICIDLAPTIFGFDGDVSKDIEATNTLIEKYNGSGRVHVRFGPHSAYLCNESVLEQLVDAAKKAHVGIHLHVSETAEQVEQHYAKYGVSPFDTLKKVGGFDLPCIVAHGLYANKSDIEEINSNDNITVAVCPKTYAKLGMGAGSLWSDYDYTKLAIGADGAASSNSVDALEQAQLFALLGKWNNRAEDFTLANIWKMLMNGHKALGFHSGKLAEGYAADLNIWELNTPATAPLYNPLAAMIYSANAKNNIVHTLVGGEFVKRNGNLCMNVQELLENANRCAQDITIKGKGQSRLLF